MINKRYKKLLKNKNKKNCVLIKIVMNKVLF